MVKEFLRILFRSDDLPHLYERTFTRFFVSLKIQFSGSESIRSTPVKNDQTFNLRRAASLPSIRSASHLSRSATHNFRSYFSLNSCCVIIWFLCFQKGAFSAGITALVSFFTIEFLHHASANSSCICLANVGRVAHRLTPLHRS